MKFDVSLLHKYNAALMIFSFNLKHKLYQLADNYQCYILFFKDDLIESSFVSVKKNPTKGCAIGPASAQCLAGGAMESGVC